MLLYSNVKLCSNLLVREGKFIDVNISIGPWSAIAACQVEDGVINSALKLGFFISICMGTL